MYGGVYATGAEYRGLPVENLASFIVIGPIDTDMNRGLEIPKAAPEAAAAGIFDGFEKGEEEIFPDPGSQSIAEGWRNGVSKALEREFKAFVHLTAARAE